MSTASPFKARPRRRQARITPEALAALLDRIEHQEAVTRRLVDALHFVMRSMTTELQSPIVGAPPKRITLLDAYAIVRQATEQATAASDSQAPSHDADGKARPDLVRVQ